MNPYPVGTLGGRRVFDVGTFNDAAVIVRNAAGISGGRGVLVSRFHDRAIVSLDRQAAPVHPWFTGVEWHEDTGDWWVRVVPGFVNGKPVNVPALAYQDENKQHVVPTLLDDLAWPILPRTYRDIRGREFGEAVPRYFRDLGVAEEKSGASAGGALGVTINLSEQSAEGARLLRAVDVVLTAFRWTYKLDVSTPGNLVLGQIVDYTVLLDTSQAFRPPIIGVMPQIPKPEADDSFMQRLMGNFGDEGMDQILVSTIYFVSPPKHLATKPLDQVTGEWTPAVKHNLFWNLGYWSEVEMPVNFKQSSDAFLGFFVGRYTVAPQATLGAMEAMFQSVLAAAFNKKPSGVFYTI